MTKKEFSLQMNIIFIIVLFIKSCNIFFFLFRFIGAINAIVSNIYIRY